MENVIEMAAKNLIDEEEKEKTSSNISNNNNINSYKKNGIIILDGNEDISLLECQIIPNCNCKC